MNREDIFLLLNRVSTPTGYTLYGDITLDDSSCEEIIDYIEQKEEENINYKQALIDIREYTKSDNALIGCDDNDKELFLRDYTCSNYILQIIDKNLGDEK